MAIQSKALSLNFTVTEIAEAVAHGEITPNDVIEYVLARIDATEDRIHAWSQIDPADARAQAAELTAEAAAGKLRGPLHGVPVSIKEWFNVKGMPNFMKGPDSPPEPENATVVAKLRQAGAIIVGKTHTPINGKMPPTRNPWNLEHTAGGTSSGSGASVGSRVVPISVGEQTGGSNLRPAAFCGVSGIKPTYGRISRYGCAPGTWSRDHAGLIGLNMEDMALVLSCVAGYDPKDQASLHDEPPPADLKMSDFAPPSFGIVRNFYPERTETVMLDAIEKSAETLAGNGAIVKDIILPDDFGLAWSAGAAVAAEGATRRVSTMSTVKDYGAGTTRGASELIPATYYIQARRIRTWLIQEVVRLMAEQHVDTLVMAVAPGAAPFGLHSTGDASLLAPWSFLGFPAITVNGGLTPEGLPLGLQMVGEPREDYKMLRIGAWCEKTLGLLPPPPVV